MERIDGDRHLPDLGITHDEALALLDQYMSQQISLDDFWWLLGFDFYDRRQQARLDVLFNGGEKMKYLVNKRKRGNTAHIWIDGDTACRCYANGSLGRQQVFEVKDTSDGREVCKNCMSKIGA